MGNKIWKEGYEIKFRDSPDKPHGPGDISPKDNTRSRLWKHVYGIKFKDTPDKPNLPEKLEKSLPTDALPARNGIWDSQNGNDIEKAARHGFTMAELTELGAFIATNEEKNILPNNLKGDVHPAFSVERWETSVPAHFRRKHMFPLGPDSQGVPRPGNYTANNLVIWKVLLPCLRLASKFVENAHIFPWYAAFLHSDVHPITNTTSEAERLAIPLQKLHLPSQSDMANPAMERATRERIAEISQDICLGISDGTADPRGTSPELKLRYDGVAIPSWEDDKKKHRIYLAYQIIEPLLDDRIGPSTRLALQFHVALTLLHEFAHVLQFAKIGEGDVKLYLDNERMSEAGFSFEMSTFGGHPVFLLQHANRPDYNGPLRAGFLLEDWLGTAKGHQWIEPLSGTDADWDGREWREARSIPISFLEELAQENFWRCFVGKWGAEALKVYPWTEGRLVQKSGNTLKSQIYSTPKQNRRWLKAAQEVPHKSAGQLTPDEIIAVQIANRRISREKEISTLVEARRKFEEQERQGETDKTLSPEPSQKDDSLDDPTGAEIIGQEIQTPWRTRAENIETMRVLLGQQANLCAEEDERVKTFLKRKDIGTPDYLTTQRALMNSNMRECKSFRKLIQNAFEDDLLEGNQKILQNYETLKEQLGRVSRRSSEDRELETVQEATNDRCAAYLRRARACRDRGEHKRCCDYCKKVLSEDDIALYLRAGAFLICGLSTIDLEWKVWYLSESVRVYKLMEHFEGETPRKSTVIKRQYAEQRLAEAKDKLTASKAAKVSSPPSTQITKTIQSATPPKTPPNPKGSRPVETSLRKKRRQPFTGFSSPFSNLPTPPTRFDPAPTDMSPSEIIKHRRTFKVINQARRNFFNGDYDVAERGFLELLNLQGTSEWQKARCHVFLASIKSRNDRAERARTALNMYRGFMRKWPEDQRCIVAVSEAEELEKRVLAEVEWENAAALNPEGEKWNAEVSDSTGPGLNTIVEAETEDSTGEGEGEIEEERSGLVAGAVKKVATLLGLKRRREDDDDGENERSTRGRRRTHFA